MGLHHISKQNTLYKKEKQELSFSSLRNLSISLHANVCYNNIGVEARGFLFGPSIALAIGAKFIPLRKPGKLPGWITFFTAFSVLVMIERNSEKLAKLWNIGKVISESYELEYGHDRLEMHVGAVEPRGRVIIIDDLVATGGTLSAAMSLLGFFLFLVFFFNYWRDFFVLNYYYVRHFDVFTESQGAEVVECACVIGLPEVKVSHI